nr:kelch repeat-containing protein [Marinicella sp. NBU2979]
MRLPQPLSNHAVAYLNINGQDQFYTFNGLRAGKTHRDISNQAHVWYGGQWHDLQPPKTQQPVLASVAVTVGDSVYLFGGYTVAADHSEHSVPNVWRIHGQDHQWTALPPMPTPVDDAVALVYQARYIYLISGWHDVDNVDLVQVFDVETQTWQQASPWPMPPVFGHAGGMVGNQMVVCDGVKVAWSGEQKSFLPSPACAMGTINPQQITEINWQPIPHHSGTAFYRMAAASDAAQQIFFVAGSDNPYNYDGIGYNGVPSAPSATVRQFDLNTQQWTIKAGLIPASMDHRSLLRTPHGYMIMGGMGPQQAVLDHITTIKTTVLETSKQP